MCFTSAKRISKIRKDKEVWYTVDQTEDIRVFLDESGMTGARTQHAPMPDKHEISSDPELVTEQEHKMYRSQVGSLMYFTETRHDISYEVSRFGASFPETPWLRVRRAGLCRGRPGGYAFGKVPQGGPRSRIGLRWSVLCRT